MTDTAIDPRLLKGSDFPVRWPVTTRWSDNDMFGHLNNAVYYEMFDGAINGWIITRTGVDPMSTPAIGVVAESGCRFLSELAYPDDLWVGIAVSNLGRSSVTYTLGLFRAGGADSDLDAARPAAVGKWVHVYIDRDTRKIVPMPTEIRELLATAVPAT